MPMNHSRVFTRHATAKESVEKTADPSTMNVTTPRTPPGLRRSEIPIANARI